MAQSGQTYATHTRWFPPVHYFMFPVFLIAARVMAIAVQDRVVRLEERLRMRELLPADLQARIGEFTREQFVGLRFASDGELPALVRQVLAGELKSVTDIKKAVTQWRGDDLRA